MGDDLYTRKQYLADYSAEGRSAFRRYYAQFATPEVIGHVVSYIGGDRIKASTDEAFNDIPLRLWDSLYPPIDRALFMQLDPGGMSLSDKVSIAKEAARIWREGQAS